MAKFCIFCGQPPQDKNKEHVVPRWLIEHTGDLTRQIALGLDHRTGKPRSFSFDSFQFPACEKCNTDFGKREARVKPIALKFLAGDPVSVPEVDLFMDWLDKVRVGLWLGFWYLDKGVMGIEPQFQILNRIREKDRSLLFYRTALPWKGVQFTGVTFPSFQVTPSCFSLRINNCYFFNVSYDFLLSARIGFPFPKTYEFHPEENRKHLRITADLDQGFGRAKFPILKTHYLEPTLAIHQPILPRKMISESLISFRSDYVKNNLLPGEDFVGAPFVETKDGGQFIQGTGPAIQTAGAVGYPGDLNDSIAIQALDFNDLLVDVGPGVRLLPKDEQKRHRDASKTLKLWNKKARARILDKR